MYLPVTYPKPITELEARTRYSKDLLSNSRLLRAFGLCFEDGPIEVQHTSNGITVALSNSQFELDEDQRVAYLALMTASAKRYTKLMNKE